MAAKKKPPSIPTITMKPPAVFALCPVCRAVQIGNPKKTAKHTYLGVAGGVACDGIGDPPLVFRVGDNVTADVPWPGGRTSNMAGTLISIANGEVFFASVYGPVAGKLATLEAA